MSRTGGSSSATRVAERMYGVASVYSDDHGRTWQSTGAVPVSVDYPINEARLVQRDDGTVLINGRYAAGGNRQRITSVSKDRGLTWSAPTMDGGTGTFNAVDAGMLGYTRGRILFSRPDAPVRYNMTVSISYDDAQTFRYSRVINPNRSYYSDLARLSDGTIVLIYGCDGDIASFPLRVNICRFNLEWLTQGRDSLAKGPRLKTKSYKLAGDRLEYHVTAPGPGEYELWLRYYRSTDGGLVSVTVDGLKPRNNLIDTTSETANGYDVLLLGTVRLRAGQHVVRFAPAGAGRGGGQSISLDQLTLTRHLLLRTCPRPSLWTTVRSATRSSRAHGRQAPVWRGITAATTPRTHRATGARGSAGGRAFRRMVVTKCRSRTPPRPTGPRPRRTSSTTQTAPAQSLSIRPFAVHPTYAEGSG